jgi:hypothetical protein
VSLFLMTLEACVYAAEDYLSLLEMSASYLLPSLVLVTNVVSDSFYFSVLLLLFYYEDFLLSISEG